tara:strand:- start:200 stop:907 length:708 start_codon:yes stop_codon:yes gene_type:complete
MGEASLVEMTVVKVSPYLREDRPLVWLSEKEGGQPRLLPIAIGEFEAAAIQMQLKNDEPIRPISYDLLSSMLDCLTIGVRQVIIHNVRRSIYYAKVVIEKDHKIKDIDSRPSDAIALALRTSSPIYVARELLDKVGLEPLETELDIEHTLDRFYELEPQISEPLNPEAEAANISLPESQFAQTPDLREADSPAEEEKNDLTRLQLQLQHAVLCEEYEEAARLRDAIDLLEDKTSP